MVGSLRSLGVSSRGQAGTTRGRCLCIGRENCIGARRKPPRLFVLRPTLEQRARWGSMTCFNLKKVASGWCLTPDGALVTFLSLFLQESPGRRQEVSQGVRYGESRAVVHCLSLEKGLSALSRLIGTGLPDTALTASECTRCTVVYRKMFEPCTQTGGKTCWIEHTAVATVRYAGQWRGSCQRSSQGWKSSWSAVDEGEEAQRKPTGGEKLLVCRELLPPNSPVVKSFRQWIFLFLRFLIEFSRHFLIVSLLEKSSDVTLLVLLYIRLL